MCILSIKPSLCPCVERCVKVPPVFCFIKDSGIVLVQQDINTHAIH